MKLSDISKSLLLTLSMSALTVACGNDNADYAGPGPQVAEDCMKVCFSGDNEADFIFDPISLGDDYSIDIVLTRAVTDETVDIPVIVEWADDCFEIPSNVHFEAGEASTSIKVSFPGIPTKVQKDFSIKIPEEYVDLYSMDQSGSGNYVGHVLVSEWKKIIKEAEFYGYDLTYCFSDIYWLEGQNRFKIENFLESGVDLTFMLSTGDTPFNPNDVATWTGNVIPLDHFQMRNSTTPSWYLVNEEGERFSWTSSYYGYTFKTSVYFRTDGEYFEIEDMEGDPTGDNPRGYIYPSNANKEWIYMYWYELNIDGYDD